MHVLTPDGYKTVTKAADTSSSPLGDPALAAQVLGMNAQWQQVATPDDIEQAMREQGLESDAPFSPGRPISPFHGYNTELRRWNFKTGRNISTRPRSERTVSFETLSQIFEAYDIANICVNHRADDVVSRGWSITPMEGIEDDVSDQVKRAKQFMECPDGRNDTDTWLKMVVGDILRFDALTLHRLRNNKGDLIALEVVDGRTISPLVDYYGRVPEPPSVAYVQFWNGTPAVWSDTDELIYKPFRPSTNSVYGTPPLEYMLLTANTDIRFQWFFLQYFTDGTIPGTFMEAPPDQSSPSQIQEWQDTWDAWLRGDQATKHEVWWVPSGAKPTPARNDQFDFEFPLFLMRKTCASFAVTPNDIGFTDDVNRASADTQVDVQERVGTLPLLTHIEGIVNSVLQADLGLPVAFQFDAGTEKEDRLAEAQAWSIWIDSGVASPDEPRKMLGLPIDPENPVPRFINNAKAGPIPLETILSDSGAVDPETYAPGADDVAQLREEAKEAASLAVASNILPSNASPAQQVEAHDGTNTPAQQTEAENGTNTPAQQAAAANGTAPAAPPGEEDEEPDDKKVAKLLAVWQRSSRNRVRVGRKPRLFVDKALPDDVASAIWKRLAVAKTRDDVDAAFEAVKADPKALTSTST